MDELTGGKNGDRFVLGDTSHVHYLGEGDSDYARILHFSTTEGVLLQKLSQTLNMELRHP